MPRLRAVPIGGSGSLTLGELDLREATMSIGGAGSSVSRMGNAAVSCG